MLDSNWVSVTLPTVIFAGIVDRMEFDSIALPVNASDNPAHPVLTKVAIHGTGAEQVRVVFQHWYGPTPAERAAEAAVARARAAQPTAAVAA